MWKQNKHFLPSTTPSQGKRNGGSLLFPSQDTHLLPPRLGQLEIATHDDSHPPAHPPTPKVVNEEEALASQP